MSFSINLYEAEILEGARNLVAGGKSVVSPGGYNENYHESNLRGIQEKIKEILTELSKELPAKAGSIVCGSVKATEDHSYDGIIFPIVRKHYNIFLEPHRYGGYSMDTFRRGYKVV